MSLKTGRFLTVSVVLGVCVWLVSAVVKTNPFVTASVSNLEVLGSASRMLWLSTQNQIIVTRELMTNAKQILLHTLKHF